jgi:hypothetical protein
MIAPTMFTVIPEPELVFGVGRAGADGQIRDPQRGLSTHGPYSHRLGRPWHPPKVRLLPVAAESDWDTCLSAVNRLNDFERMPQLTARLRTDYPGFDSTFRCPITIDTGLPSQRISDAAFESALSASSASVGYRRVLDICDEAIANLGLTGSHEVVLLQLPAAIIDRFRRLDPEYRPLTPSRPPKRDKLQMLLFEDLTQSVEDDRAEETLYHDLRRSLKVRCMRRKIALQIVTSAFVTEDEACPWAYKLWNISTSIFCKAGGIPWRLANAEDVAYCGIRFGIQRTSSGQEILVGLAQVVNANGQLVAVKAGAATRSQRRSESGYYLGREQARQLIRSALSDFESVVGRLPRRVVIHKSSPFKAEEVAGMEEAASGIRNLDLVYLKEGCGIRLLPERGQPADRGTALPTSDRSMLLYTSGHVPEFEKYGGLHVPTPIELVVFRSDRPMIALANDVLKLTKMNWNSTVFDCRLPSTFDNATEMIGMMKELGPNERLDPDIRYYI